MWLDDNNLVTVVFADELAGLVLTMSRDTEVW